MPAFSIATLGVGGLLITTIGVSLVAYVTHRDGRLGEGWLFVGPVLMSGFGLWATACVAAYQSAVYLLPFLALEVPLIVLWRRWLRRIVAR